MHRHMSKIPIFDHSQELEILEALKSGVFGIGTLTLRNNGGEDYLLYSLTISGCGTLTPASPQSVAAGSTTPFAIQCAVPPLTAALAAGGTFKGDITINYRKIGSSVDLTSTGTLAEKITA